MKTGKKIWTRFCAVLAVLTLGCPAAAWAGWTQQDGNIRYEDESGHAVGWQEIDGFWYYFDTETGIYNSRPYMTGEAASHLLCNKLKEANLYQDEGAELICRVDYMTDSMIRLSAGIQTSPNDFSIINTFEVQRKYGTAESKVTKQKFNLWE